MKYKPQILRDLPKSISLSLNNKNDFGRKLLCLFVVALYLPMIFTNILTILLVIFCLIRINKQKAFFVFRDKFVILMIIFYSILSLGFLYDIPIATVLNGLEKKLSFVLLPIIVGLIGVRKRDIRIIVALLFYTGVIVTTFAVMRIFLSPAGISGVSSFINHELSSQINIHATYLSMYLLFSLSYPTFYLNEINRRVQRVFVYICTLLTIVYIMLLGVRIIWLILFGFIFYCAIHAIIRSGYSKKVILIISLGIVVISTIIFSVGPLRERAKELINYNNEYSTKEVWGGRGIRLMIWQSCIELIKEEPVFGYGSSTAVQTQLEEVYRKNNLGPLLYLMEKKGENFNPHNQYLSELLKHGFFLGWFYPFVLLIIGKEYYRNNSKFGFFFLFLIVGVSLTETILELNKGIVFFAYFGSIIHFSLKGKSSKIAQIRLKHEYF